MAPDETSHKIIVSTSIFGLLLANVAVILRLTARWVGDIKVTIDDYLMIVALLPYWGVGIGGVILVHNGLGEHLANIPLPHFQTFLKVQYAGTFLYTSTVALTKISILAMYWRVLPCESVRRNVYVCGGLVMAWAIATCVTGAVACLPVYRLWTPGVKGTCINWAAFYYGIQIPNILTDAYIVVIPIREIRSLRLTKLQKYSLYAIFGIATLTIIFDIVRLVAMIQFSESKEDFTISIISVAIWTTVEPGVGIFAACMSNLRPLFRRFSFGGERLQRFNTNDRKLQLPHIEDSQGTSSSATYVGTQSVDGDLKMQPVVTVAERNRSAASNT